MSDRIASLRTHQCNIDRYERLLGANLSELELRFVQRRLSEERFALAILQCMAPSDSSNEYEAPDARRR
jgi:hypothetical protein